MKVFFWISLAVVFYTYLGYGLVLLLLIKIRRLVYGKRKQEKFEFFPSVTIIIAAYDEANIIEEKLRNTLSLHYPKDRIKYIVVTDGSSDDTPEKVMLFPSVKLLHSPERKGKINAIHRAMMEVSTEITVFTDANTYLNNDAIINIARHYQNETVGAVSGEKRVSVAKVSDATAGEGFYWKYESLLKKWDSELCSVVGAAGELFSIRTSLYQPVPSDTILDDFMISLVIAAKGYKIVYEPQAYALEESSANTKEELKRKIRIAAGGIQSILRLRSLMNPFKHPVLSFQYISHRVLRWTVTPFFMILSLLLNILIVAIFKEVAYAGLLVLQALFYILSFLGWVMDRTEIKIKVFFIPYYFCLMNYAVLKGIIRYFFGSQSASWDKAIRKVS